MAVTAFIERLKQGTNGEGPSDQELGMDYGMGGAAQVPLKASANRDTAHSRYLQDPSLAHTFLKEIYGPLKRHYEWFRRTQRGQIKQYSRKARSRTEAYRWRGRTEQHVLTSGMDDYPRGRPHAGELHLDLISWMAFFSRTMRDIASFIGEKDDEMTYIQNAKAIIDNIEGSLTFKYFYARIDVVVQIFIGTKKKTCIAISTSMMKVAISFFLPCATFLKIISL